jgi:hypothetical protein
VHMPSHRRSLCCVIHHTASVHTLFPTAFSTSELTQQRSVQKCASHLCRNPQFPQSIAVRPELIRIPLQRHLCRFPLDEGVFEDIKGGEIEERVVECLVHKCLEGCTRNVSHRASDRLRHPGQDACVEHILERSLHHTAAITVHGGHAC